MAITEFQKLKTTYKRLLERYQLLKRNYLTLQSEHNVLKTLHANVLENCINDKIKLQKRIKKLKEWCKKS